MSTQSEPDRKTDDVVATKAVTPLGVEHDEVGLGHERYVDANLVGLTHVDR